MLRLLATADLVGSFFPHAASHGVVPGAGALARRAAELRDESDASLWIDTGDFAQGSALGVLSDGSFGFLAMHGLGVDVGVLGNHELDWGREHLRRWAKELPFPLLAANAGIGLEGAAIFPAGDWRVGIVGLSHPRLDLLHPEVPVHGEPAAIAVESAAELRAAGADVVVLGLHDGVDFGVVATGVEADTARLERFCGELGGAFDAVLGGHTLGRHAGSIGGVPFVQPAPFSAELGVVDFERPGAEARLALEPILEPVEWTGPGRGAFESLAEEIVGQLSEPLANSKAGEAGLSRLIAEGLIAADEDLDVAVVPPWDIWNQAPLDGVNAYLPAGEVSMAQVLRLTPLCGGRSSWGGQLLRAELGSAELEKAVATVLADIHAPAGLPPATAAVGRRAGATGGGVLCVPPHYAPRIDQALGWEADWRVASATWRDGLQKALA